MKDRHHDLAHLGHLNAILFLILTFSRVEASAVVEKDACSSQSDCKAGKFCAQPPLSRLPGTCGHCWKCCLFPQAYGLVACSRCRCRAERACVDDNDCGPAEFCAVPRSRAEPPTCQPCTVCRNDSRSWRGSCAAACLSGSLDINEVAQQAAAHYTFMVYDIGLDERAQAGLTTDAGAPVTVTEDAVRAWLAGYPSHIVETLLASRPLPLALPSPPPRLQRQPQGPPAVGVAAQEAPRNTIAVGVLAARLAALLPQPDTLCPVPPSDLARMVIGFGSSSYVPPASIVPEGCPCNATKGAASFRCAAGHRCAPGAWTSLPGDVVALGNVALLKARCVKCDQGSYCPEGTYLEEGQVEHVATQLDCPAGHYCGVPHEKSQCPPGFFCPFRTVEPLTCDYEKLLEENKDAINSWSYDKEVSRDVLRRLLRDGEPLRGNYCPNGSVLPTRRCSPGFYCPTPAEELPCPEAHYCRAENVAPTHCPPLTLCPTGSAAPAIWPAALLSFVGLAVLAVLLAVLVRMLDRSKKLSVTDQERRSSAERQLREFTATFLNRRPWALARYPELAALKRYHLVVEDLTWRAGGRTSGQSILNGITGSFEAGQLAAVLGPSGCGKSSLLALLAGRAPRWPASSGQIWLYDLGTGVRREVTDPRDIREIVGFVPQDDIVCADLTIRENLEYSAALRLPLRRDRRRLLPFHSSSRSTAAPAAPAVGSPPAASPPSTLDSPLPGISQYGLGQGQGQGRGPAPQAGDLPTPFANTWGLRAGATGDTTSAGTSNCNDNGNCNGDRTGSGAADRAEGPAGTYAAATAAAGGEGVASAKGPGRIGRVNAGRVLKNSPSSAGKGSGGGSADGGSAGCGGGGGGGGGEAQRASTAAAAPVAQRQRRLTPNAECRKVVDEVLRMMALRNLHQYRVGNLESRIISGGQRKRLNIGLELVSRPSLLFLDEPTSGLDASCSASVLRALHSLASSGGVNVAAVVHQPRHSIFSMFHQVQLLGEAGCTVYHGSPRAVQDYFESLGYTFPPNENVADTLLDIVTGKVINQKSSITTAKLPRCWRERRELLSPTRGPSGRTAPWAALPVPAPGVQSPLVTPAAAGGGGAPWRFLSQASDGETDVASLHGSHPATAAAAVGAAVPAGGGSVAGSSVGAAVAVAAGGGSGAPPMSPHEPMGGFSKPEFTEDTKEVLEAEFDRLLRSPPPRLSYSPSAMWTPSLRRSSNSTARGSFRPAPPPPPDGLGPTQLKVLFKTLGQEDADAEALVRVIMAAHAAAGGSDSGHVPYISKEQLIATLLDIASGVVRIPELSEDEGEGQGDLEEAQSVMTNVAAVATATLEAFQSFNQAVLRRMPRFRFTAGSLVRQQMSRAASGELTDSLQPEVDGIGSRAVSGSPLERSSLSNIPLVFNRLLTHTAANAAPAGAMSAAASPRGSFTWERQFPGRPSGGAVVGMPAETSTGAQDGDLRRGMGDAAAAANRRSRISSRDIGRAIAAAAALMPGNPSSSSLADPEVPSPGSRTFMGLLRSSVKKFNRPRAASAVALEDGAAASPASSCPAGRGEPLGRPHVFSRVPSRSAAVGSEHLAPRGGSRRMASYRIFPPAIHYLAAGGASPHVSGVLPRLPPLTADDTIAEEDEARNSGAATPRAASAPRAATEGDADAEAEVQAPGVAEGRRSTCGDVDPPAKGGVEAAAGVYDPNETATAARQCGGQTTSDALPRMGYQEPAALQRRISTVWPCSRFALETSYVGILLDRPQQAGQAGQAGDRSSFNDVTVEGLGAAAAAHTPATSTAPASAATALASAVVTLTASSSSPASASATSASASPTTASASAASATSGTSSAGPSSAGPSSAALLSHSAAPAVGAGVPGVGVAGEDAVSPSVFGADGSLDTYMTATTAEYPLSTPFAVITALPEGFNDAERTGRPAKGTGGVVAVAGTIAAGARVGKQPLVASALGGACGTGAAGKGRARPPAPLKVAGLEKCGSSRRLAATGGGSSQQQQQQQQERDASQFSSPGWFPQLWTFSKRAVVQSSRAFWPAGVLEVALLLAAAAAVGANHGRNWGPTAVPGNAIMAMLCLAVLAVVQHLGTFSTNRPMTNRERGAGLSSTAFFVAKCLVDVPWILVAPIIFTLPYFVLTVPRARLVLYYIVSVGVWWWASGLAYLVTLLPLVPSAAAPTVAVLITLIAGALLHGGGSPTLAEARGTPAAGLLGVSYNRWAMEALSIAELDNYMDTHRNVIASMYSDKGTCDLDLVVQGNLHELGTADEQILAYIQLSTTFGAGYCRSAWKIALIALFSLGAVLRLLAMLALRYDSTIIWLMQATLRRGRELRRWLQCCSPREDTGDLATVTTFGAPSTPMSPFRQPTNLRTAYGQKEYGRDPAAGTAVTAAKLRPSASGSGGGCSGSGGTGGQVCGGGGGDGSGGGRGGENRESHGEVPDRLLSSPKPVASASDFTSTTSVVTSTGAPEEGTGTAALEPNTLEPSTMEPSTMIVQKQLPAVQDPLPTAQELLSAVQLPLP